MAPSEPSTCLLLRTKQSFLKREMNVVRVVVKVFYIKPGGTLVVPSLRRYGNPYREIAMGRLLNMLVRYGVTPHLPLIYENFTIGDTHVGLVTELSHMTFKDFLMCNLMRQTSDETVTKLIGVALLQICHGIMCAQDYYDFRHNDLHPDNVMMTFISNTVYNYRIGDRLFAVRNYGMCWKLIDFGLCSSKEFAKDDVARAYAHYKVLRALKPMESETKETAAEESVMVETFRGFALEMWDVVYLLLGAIGTVRRSTHVEARKTLIERVLHEKLMTLKRVSRDSTVGDTLELAYLHGMARLEKHPTESVVTSDYVRNARNTSLLKFVFSDWAKRYETAHVPSDSVVFQDNGAIPMTERESILLSVVSPPAFPV